MEEESNKVEKTTAKIDKSAGGRHAHTPPASRRMYDVESLRTQKLSSRVLAPKDVDQLFGRLQSFMVRFGHLHQADTLEGLYLQATTAISALFDVSHWAAYSRQTNGNFTRWIEREGGGPEVGEAIKEMLSWAFDSRQLMFFDAEDLADEDSRHTICIIPVIGDNIHHACLLFWCRDRIEAMNVLQVDMLNVLGRDLALRASNLLQRGRLIQLSSLFDNIIESVPHAIVAISGDDRVVALNGNAEFLFGVKRIFAMDEPYRDAFPAQVVEVFDRLIGNSLMSGAGLADTEINLDINNTKISLGVSLNLLRGREGKPQGHLFLCRDLSLSREVQKLRELDQLKSEFVNTVSHELKTPLTAILGGLEVLEDDIPKMDEDTQEMMGVISDGAHRLKSLIFDLLDVSRLEAGRIDLKEEHCDLRDVIREALSVQQPHPKHTLVVQVDDDVPLVLIDRAKIVQCITNYVSNAIKYSPKGGEVTVQASINDVTRMVVIGVKDQGLGIAPEHQKKVWEKFYRIDASYTADIEGTGLGLVIVKRIVELHGGVVWIESELGKGSTFCLSLPLKKLG